MNKFNTIKILEEEKKESLMVNRSLGKEDFKSNIVANFAL